MSSSLNVINVGLSSFADAVEQAGGSAVNVNWRPPADGDVTMGNALAKLVHNQTIDAANRMAFDKYLNAQPVLEGIGRAGDVLPGMGERTILHSGPPIDWQEVCGPVHGAIIGAILY